MTLMSVLLHRRQRTGLAGILLVLLIAVSALIAPWLAPAGPLAINLGDRAMPPLSRGTTGLHLLGTDQLGRDLTSRIIYGGRVSIIVGFLAVGVSAPIGILAGLVSAQSRQSIDSILMRIVDTQLAIPFLLLAVAFVSLLGPSLVNVILVLGIAGWVLFARVTRAEVLSVRSQQFVEAARAIGASNVRIVLRHVLPNILNSTFVIASFAIAQMILLEATLSFLGFGVQPPTPSWGNMLSEGRPYLVTAWWISTFPGLAILLTVTGVNMVAEWVRETLDPRTRDERVLRPL